MDPLEFRPDSVLGVPGLMRAYRAGSVAIVNAVGTGVADDKAIYHYVPEMIRYYLSEEPLLAERPDLPDERPRAARVDPRPPGRGRGQADQRVRRQGRLHRAARERAGAGRAGGGAQAHAGALDRAGARPALARCRPPARTARSRRATSTCARSRSSARTSTSCPGGLTRVALREGSMIVNSSQGGGSKDTWVLEQDADGARRARAAVEVVAAADARAAARRRLVLPAAATAAIDAGPDRPRAVLDRPPAGARRAHLAHARRRLPRRPAGPARRSRRRAAVAGTRC